MTWVNLDDQFPEHPKIDKLSDAAFRLHVAAICYANRHLTDGYLDAARIPRLVPKHQKRFVTELVNADLWETVDGGYQIHDYLDWNKSRDEVETAQAKLSKVRAEAGRKGARARWGNPVNA